MRALRLLLPATLAIGLVPLAAAPALAAPPDNDEVAGARVLHLGDHIVQDTTEATTTADDATLNTFCGAPETNASVWYKYTPARNRQVALDMTASDYSGGFLVFEGDPTAESLITCGPGVVGFNAHAGTTYYVMVISDTEVNGGTLDMTFKVAHAPRVHVSLAKRGLAYHGGAALIHGRYFCKHGESFAFIQAHLLQRAGRLKIQGDHGFGIRCNGKRHRWSARIVSPVGTYARGPAVAKARIIACGLVECRQERAKRHIHLRWAPRTKSAKWMQTPTTRLAVPRAPSARQPHWSSS